MKADVQTPAHHNVNDRHAPLVGPRSPATSYFEAYLELGINIYNYIGTNCETTAPFSELALLRALVVSTRVVVDAKVTL